MTRNELVSRMMYTAGVLTLGLVGVGPVWSLDPPNKSTGTGVIQGEDGSMSTKRGGNTGPSTGRNEHSGSATGTVRNPSKSEPPHDDKRGSSQLGSDSSHEASQTEGRGQSGVRTDK
jgi:hypothetical protein